MQPRHGKISVIQLLLLVFLLVSAVAAAYQLYYLPHFVHQSRREYQPVLSRDQPVGLTKTIIRGKISNRGETGGDASDAGLAENASLEKPPNPVLLLPGRLADSAQNMVAGLAMKTKDLSLLLEKPSPPPSPEPEAAEPEVAAPEEPAAAKTLSSDGFPTEITELEPPAPRMETTPPPDAKSELTESVTSDQFENLPADQILYAVQVRSTPNRDEADQTLARLNQTPYTVYSYPIEIKGKTLIRIRVGFFKSYEEALRAADRIASMAMDLPKPWVTPVERREFADHRRDPVK